MTDFDPRPQEPLKLPDNHQEAGTPPTTQSDQFKTTLRQIGSKAYYYDARIGAKMKANPIPFALLAFGIGMLLGHRW